MLNTPHFAKDVVLNNKDLAKDNETVQKNNVFSENKLTTITFVLLMSDDEIIDICHMNIRGHFQMKRFVLRCRSDIKGEGGSGA